MAGERNYYSILGVARDVTTDELKRAYRRAALRLHPDKNIRPGETDLFIEINEAYEVLLDPARRAAYDAQLEKDLAKLASEASFRYVIQHSRQNLLLLDEPQVHYMLIDVYPGENLPSIRPPVNVAIVIDRSTSMRGQRLDQVRSAALMILKSLEASDSAVVVAFSDKADLIVSADQAQDESVARARMSLLQAGGGTEIGRGLELALAELRGTYSREGVNHLILLTDGRTYGDEDKSLELAETAGELGITVNAIGIGSNWSDRFLDDLAGKTGGNVTFLDSPRAVTDLLSDIFDSLSRVGVSRVRIEGNLAQQVDLRSAFRLSPEPMPLGDPLPRMLGNLPREGKIRLLMELVIHPVGRVGSLTLASLRLTGDMLAPGAETDALPFDVLTPVSKTPDVAPPPKDMVSALSAVALHQMQEKARHEAELGHASQAARRLENLATQLLAGGERELAHAALTEAERLARTRRISTEGEKLLKYGTRALLLPAKSGSE